MTIRAAIREVVNTTSLANPEEVAAKVASGLADEDLRDAVLEMLPSFVRYVYSQDRLLDKARDNAKKAGRSSRVRAVRESWQQRLVAVVNIEGVYKKFGDCTSGDLATLSESLRSHAAGALAKADYYDRIAAALPDGATVSTFKSDPTEMGAAA